MAFEISNISIAAAVAAGTVSFLSPCVLPLVPGYVSFIAGNAGGARAEANPHSKAAVAFLSLFFVLGFSTVFIALGAGATTLSRVLRFYSYEAGIVGGTIVILFGLFTTGWIRLSWLQQDARYHGRITGGGPIGAYLLGLAFAFGWTPCIGPILRDPDGRRRISATASDGVALLALYSLGLGIPFVLAAMFTQTLMGSLPRMRRAGRVLQPIAGGIMIAMGAAMVTGQMSRFAFWLLETFPAFGSIG